MPFANLIRLAQLDFFWNTRHRLFTTQSIYLLMFWRSDLIGFEVALCCQNIESWRDRDQATAATKQESESLRFTVQNCASFLTQFIRRISVWAVNINIDMTLFDDALLALYLALQVNQNYISVICLKYCYRFLYRQAFTAQSLFYSLLSIVTLCSPFITAAKNHARWQSYTCALKCWQAVVELLSESLSRADSKELNRIEACW